MDTLEQKKATKLFLETVVAPVEGERYEIRVKDTRGEFTSYLLEGAKRATVISGNKSDEGNEVYFGVAPRKGNGGKKEDVERVCSLWIDLDAKGKTRHSALKTRLGKLVLPPTYAIKSGGGYHAYWVLTEPVSPDGAEQVMKALQTFFESDHVSDASRILRVPNTFNHKYRTKRHVEIEGYSPSCVYSADDVLAATRVDQHTKNLMEGTTHADFNSRSERDYAIIAELRKSGLSLDAVKFLYHWHVLLDSTVEDHGGDKYVERTYAKIEGDLGEDSLKEAIETAQVVTHKDLGKKKKERKVEGDEDGYYVGDRRISTFTLFPKRLLTSPIGQEVIVCDVTSVRGVTRNHPFLRASFNSSDSWKRELTRFDWFWSGTDKDLSVLYMQMMSELEVQTVVSATYTSGYHDGLWVTDGLTITPDRYYNGSESDAPMALIPSGNEGPKTKYKIVDDDAEFTRFLENLIDLIPKLNRPEVIIPALSWYMATPMKDLISEIAGANFPILMYTGTRGSGKTGTVQLFQRLMGYQRPSGGIDCTATKYSIDVLLGSTNGIPVSLTEYRDGDRRVREDIARRVRLSYDRSANTRGQKYDHSRSIARFDFFAPMTIDGEDAISDPACKERMVVIVLEPETIMEQSTNQAHTDILATGMDKFMARYVRFCLKYGPNMLDSTSWAQYRERAAALSHPVPMPARIMNNYAVLFFGIRMFQAFLNQYGLSFKVDTDVYRESLGNVFSTKMGRTTLSVDDFITDLVNYIQRNAQNALNDFDYRYMPDMNELWMHFTDAYNWWQQTLVRRQVTAPGSTRLKQQLKERIGVKPGSYVITNSKNVRLARTVKKAFGINVRVAAETLDIAPEMKLTSITINRTEESDK